MKQSGSAGRSGREVRDVGVEIVAGHFHDSRRRALLTFSLSNSWSFSLRSYRDLSASHALLVADKSATVELLTDRPWQAIKIRATNTSTSLICWAVER